MLHLIGHWMFHNNLIGKHQRMSFFPSNFTLIKYLKATFVKSPTSCNNWENAWESFILFAINSLIFSHKFHTCTFSANPYFFFFQIYHAVKGDFDENFCCCTKEYTSLSKERCNCSVDHMSYLRVQHLCPIWNALQAEDSIPICFCTHAGSRLQLMIWLQNPPPIQYEVQSALMRLTSLTITCP